MGGRGWREKGKEGRPYEGNGEGKRRDMKREKERKERKMIRRQWSTKEREEWRGERRGRECSYSYTH